MNRIGPKKKILSIRPIHPPLGDLRVHPVGINPPERDNPAGGARVRPTEREPLPLPSLGYLQVVLRQRKARLDRQSLLAGGNGLVPLMQRIVARADVVVS